MAIQISERTCPQPCSAKVTWTHTVAPDTLLDEVCSHGLREANHSRLGCAVHTSVHNSCLGRKNSIIEGIKNIVPFRMGTRINVLSDHCHTSSHSTLSKDWYQVFFLNSASYFLLNSQIHLCQIVTLPCTAILDLQLDFSLGPRSTIFVNYSSCPQALRCSEGSLHNTVPIRSLTDVHLPTVGL